MSHGRRDNDGAAAQSLTTTSTSTTQPNADGSRSGRSDSGDFRSNADDTWSCRFLVERISEPIQVPNDRFCRLRYYLYNATKCLDVVIPPEFISLEPLSFEPTPHYIELLVAYCIFFSPKNMGRVFIHDEKIGDYNNDFFRITPEMPLLTSSSFQIQGVSFRPIKLMKFRAVWLHRYYLDPMRELLPLAKQYAGSGAAQDHFCVNYHNGVLQLVAVSRAAALIGDSATARPTSPP